MLSIFLILLLINISLSFLINSNRNKPYIHHLNTRLYRCGKDHELRTEIALKDLQEELKKVQGTWQYCQALLSRNKSQLGSFVDAKAQWEAMDDDDKYWLGILPDVEIKMEELMKEEKRLKEILETF